MNFQSRIFFIGLMDFFSIPQPGGLLTRLLMGEVGPVELGDRYAKLAGAKAWSAFLFASYLFCHLAFLLGWWLEEFHNWTRCYKLNTQIETKNKAVGSPSRWFVVEDGGTVLRQTGQPRSGGRELGDNWRRAPENNQAEHRSQWF